MSIANLLVPNNYDLYCNEITAKIINTSGGIIDATSITCTGNITSTSGSLICQSSPALLYSIEVPGGLGSPLVIDQNGNIVTLGLTTTNGVLYPKQNTVTQTGTISTAVTINGVAGSILTVSTTLAASSSATFTVNNSSVSSSNYCFVNVLSYTGTTGVPFVTSSIGGSGNFTITIYNYSTIAALNGTLKIIFLII